MTPLIFEDFLDPTIPDWDYKRMESSNEGFPVRLFYSPSIKKFIFVQKLDKSKKYWGRKSRFKILIDGTFISTTKVQMDLKEDIDPIVFKNFNYVLQAVSNGFQIKEEAR